MNPDDRIAPHDPHDGDALERALVDLGAHLDEPSGADVAASVVDALRAGGHSSATSRSRPRPPARGRVAPRRLVASAATVAFVVVGLLAFAPARQAIAQRLGIGTVEITNDSVPPPIGALPIPGGSGTTVVPGSAPAAVRPVSLDDARHQLAFQVRVPKGQGVGEMEQALIDDRAPGGLLTLAYPGLAVVEVASPRDEAPAVGKSVQPGTQIQTVGVVGHPGIWLAGDPHAVGYLDREGHLRSDTVRRAGNVLVWTADGATYRLEGVADLTRALALAASMMTG